MLRFCGGDITIMECRLYKKQTSEFMFLDYFMDLTESELQILFQLFSSKTSYHSPILLEHTTERKVREFSQNIFKVTDSDDRYYFWFDWIKVNPKDNAITVQPTKKGAEFLRRNKDFYFENLLHKFSQIRSKYTKYFLPFLLNLEQNAPHSIYKKHYFFTPKKMREILHLPDGKYMKPSDVIRRCLEPIEYDFPESMGNRDYDAKYHAFVEFDFSHGEYTVRAGF